MIRTFRKIWEFSKNRHAVLCRTLFCSFLRSAFGATQLVAVIFAAQFLTGRKEFLPTLLWICCLCGVCVVGNYFASYYEQTSSMQTSFHMIADKRLSTAQLLRKFPLGFFNDTSCGKITATLTSTLSGVETAAVMCVVGIVSGIFNSIVLLTVILFFQWKIGVLTLAGMLAYLLVVSWEIRVSGKIAPFRQRAQVKLADAAINFFQGIKVTKAFQFQSGDRNLKEAIEGSCKGNIGLTDRSMFSQICAGMTIAVFESAIFLTSVYLYTGVSEIGLVEVLVLLIFSFTAYAALNQAGSMLSMIGMLDSGIQELNEIEQNPQLVQQLPAEDSRSNAIEFHNVSFSYGETEVLHNINLSIAPNSLTAIVGPSGSGKTTLCQLIPRFREVTGGRITIGGADIRNMDEEKLMAKISMVFQKVYLFEETIANNIRFGMPEASIEEVRKAAKAARCDDFIMDLPHGYDTVLSEGGTGLSVGEKQRISIARAMLKDAPIILLDEATSALDAENEHEILSAIDALTKDKTVIMIAHRIQSVKKADKIVALEDGRIVQEGTHNSLLHQKGLYQDFIAAREKAMGWQLNN